MYKLSETQPFSSALQLLGADILIGATAGKKTIAMRAMRAVRALGFDLAAFTVVARIEIATYAEQT